MYVYIYIYILINIYIYIYINQYIHIYIYGHMDDDIRSDLAESGLIVSMCGWAGNAMRANQQLDRVNMNSSAVGVPNKICHDMSGIRRYPLVN